MDKPSSIVVGILVTQPPPPPPPRRKYVIKLAPLSSSSDINSNFNFGVSKSQELGSIENNDRTLKELGMLDVVYQPLCIQYLQLEPTQSYELNYSLIHLLPKFHGFAGEDPHKHLKEFHVVCSMIRPQGVPEDYIKMKTFPFSLDGATKDWLYLQPATSRETLHEYWERFNKLCATCPHHQISEQLPIQYFYEGLTMMDRSMIDSASGRALIDKMPTTTRHLILNMTSNTQ
ncbi:hypothetical protein CR513_18105, partial [Mucuna pruriens]